MSFARPQSLAGVHPDTVRIVAMSAAIALNAAALIAVMRPMVAQIVTAPLPTPSIRLIDHPVEPKVVPPPPIDMKPLPVVKHDTPTHIVKPQTVAPPAVVPTASDEGSAPMVAPTEVMQSPPAVEAAPVEAHLAYVSAPAPAYPRAAISRRMEGTVTLRVLVDEAGKPLQVEIEQSSGHEILDKTARDQVLAAWRFQPATANGRAVRAWARIPVTFDLRKL